MKTSEFEGTPRVARPGALVVSAESSLRRMTAAILRQQQYAVTEARTAAEGESSCLAQTPSLSLLIVSLQLQAFDDGLGLALRLRCACNDLAILVISTTAPTTGQMQTMREAGISHLSQDYSFARFVRAIGAQRPREAALIPPERLLHMAKPPSPAFAAAV